MSELTLDRVVEDFRKPNYSIDSGNSGDRNLMSHLKNASKKEELFSLFEAARWAPSAKNTQPWRFILARTEEDKTKFESFILPANLVWCKSAPVLALVLSKKVEDGQAYRSHAFDVGMASANLALEATKKGLITHFMGGFDVELARQVLEIPSEYELQAVIAIGYQGEKEVLSEALQSREQPSGRKELSDILFEGSLTHQMDVIK